MDALLLMAALALTGTPTVPPAHSHKHDTKSSRAVKTHHRLHREETCATCVGNVPCGACHTCELCKHCNEGKGSCGVCNRPLRTVSGTVTLQGCLNPIQFVTFQFFPTDGSFGEDHAIKLPATGAFQVTGLLRKDYILHIYGLRYLHKNVALPIVPFDVTDVKVTLYPGDVNGDHIVDIEDLDELADAFYTKPGDHGWWVGADLNCDDRVDIADLSLLADDFFMTGDPYP